MKENHLATSTPIRRSRRLPSKSMNDELNVSNLSDISMISSVSTSGRETSILKSNTSINGQQNKVKKRVSFNLSCTYSDENKQVFRTLPTDQQDQQVQGIIGRKQPKNGDRRSNRVRVIVNQKRNATHESDVPEPRKRKCTEIQDKQADLSEKKIKFDTSSENDEIKEQDVDMSLEKYNQSLMTDDEEDGLELSFKSPPARTYAHVIHKPKHDAEEQVETERALFDEDEEDIEMPMEPKKGNAHKVTRRNRKQMDKKKLSSWENAIKKNKKLEEFINTFNQELQQIECVPLSVVKSD